MKRLLVGIVALSFVFAAVGCKKKPAEKKDTDPAQTMEAMGAMTDPGMARATAAPMRPREAPPRAAAAFKPLKNLAKLIKATAACKEPVHSKCAEGKALDQYVKDLWMNKIKLSDADKIRGFKTVATLVLDKNKMVRNFAAGVMQLNPFGLRDKIAKDPGLVEKIYIVNLLQALPTLETFRSGWLMSYIPNYAPAYGLLGMCFKQADKCKNKKDIYGRILKGMTKHARLKHFDISKKYAKDHSKEGIPWATAALAGLQNFTWNKKDAVQVCSWAAKLLPAKIKKETMEESGYEYMLYRYVGLLKRCQALDSVKHLEVLTQLQKVTKMLKGLKWNSKDYPKTVGKLKDHFRKVVKKLKKEKASKGK